MVAESTTMTGQTFSPRTTIAAPLPLPETGHHSCSQCRNGSLRIFLAISSCLRASLPPEDILSRGVPSVIRDI